MTQLSEILKLYIKPRLLYILLLGFASGLPFILVSSTLTIWLAKAGYSNTTIGWMLLTTLPYCLKFLWAPLIDRYPLPYFCKKFGQRRGWALLTQTFLIFSIAGLGFTDPIQNIYMTAFYAFLLSFCAASQDIVLDAYRIESVATQELGVGTALAAMGFRIGMLTGSAGTLCLASYYSWTLVYNIIALLSLIGPLTILMVTEPEVCYQKLERPSFNTHFSTIKYAFSEFTKRSEWPLIFLFILFYKASDAIPHAWSGPLLIELEYTIEEIAYVAKTFGVFVMILGGLLGGILVTKLGPIRGIVVCGSAQLLSPCMYMLLVMVGHDMPMLITTITLQDFCCGMGNTAFVAYLSSLCTRKFTATQFSVIYSFSSFSRIILSAGAGWVSDHFEWTSFFLFIMLFGAPFLLIIAKLQKQERIFKPG